MLTDPLLYLLIPLVFVGFFLLLFLAKDSPTESERELSQQAIVVAKAAKTNNLMGYGILAGVYLVLFFCAHFLGNRHA